MEKMDTVYQRPSQSRKSNKTVINTKTKKQKSQVSVENRQSESQTRKTNEIRKSKQTPVQTTDVKLFSRWKFENRAWIFLPGTRNCVTGGLVNNPPGKKCDANPGKRPKNPPRMNSHCSHPSDLSGTISSSSIFTGSHPTLESHFARKSNTLPNIFEGKTS